MTAEAATLDERTLPIRQDPGPTPDPTGALADAETSRKIRELPKDVGVMLVAVGACGMVLPGMVGGPAVIAGGLVLWPKAFGRVESWFERTFPKAHREGMKQIGRYLDDLDRRYAYSGIDRAGEPPADARDPRSEAP